jgi:hypothetical protein
MTAEEIRKYIAHMDEEFMMCSKAGGCYSFAGPTAFALWEIAAQLAEMNQKLEKPRYEVKVDEETIRSYGGSIPPLGTK